ncbi:MAG: hypothetical protein E7447_05855 [Ruminococcaceae bacterium]|nr:hypothetical protein [Oscillospiraceae bacterium]
MKKSIYAILAFALSLLLVFSLAACQDTGNTDTPSVPTSSVVVPPEPWMPENALELWNKVDAAMDALDSVESTTVSKVVYYAMGYEFKMDSTMVSYSGKDAEYIESNIKTVCADLELDQDIKTVKAYYDGKMFSAMNDGIYDQKLCSPATKEEYAASMDGALTDKVDLADCNGGKFTKNEDGTWTIEFSGYTNKTMNKLLAEMEMSADMLGAPIEDMKATIVANEDFLVKTMTVAFVFEEQEDSIKPEYSMSAEYSKYNEAVFDADVLKAEEYTEVADLFVLQKIEDGIQERQEATTGSFVLDITTTTRYYGQTSKNKETDTVIYGKKNGGYYYSIIAEADGTKMTLVYQNGVSTITSGGESYTDALTDAQAKQTIDGLIDSAIFNSLAVTNIEKEGEGVYMITCDEIDLEIYSARLASSDIKLSSGEQAVKVTFDEDGNLVKIDSLVFLKGKLEYNDVEFDLKSVVDFEKEADFPTI